MGRQKRGPGQPRSVGSAEELENLVDLYIAKNTEDNREDVIPPTDYDFCKFLGISSSTLANYRSDKDTYPGYLEALKKLVDYREQYFVTLSLKNPKAAGAAIFALKQGKNGGYQDKPASRRGSSPSRPGTACPAVRLSDLQAVPGLIECGIRYNLYFAEFFN